MNSQITLFLFTILLVSCSSPKLDQSDEVIEKKIYASKPEKPEWLYETPADDEKYSYLVGISQKTTDEQTASDNAFAHAANSFVKSCGVRVSILDSYSRESRGQSTAGPIEQIVTGKSTEKQRANAFVSGLKIKTRYTEKYEIRQGRIKLRNSYLMALLFRIPLDECGRVKDWWKNYLNQFTKGLDRMIAEAKSFESKNDIESASRTMREAEKRIQESNIDPGDIVYHFSIISALNANYFSKWIKQKTESSIRNSFIFADSGNLVAALQTLKVARDFISDSIAGQNEQNQYFTSILNVENSLIGNLSLDAITETHQRIKPGETPGVLAVIFTYRSPKNQQRHPVRDFSILFKTRSSGVSLRTNSDGEVKYSLSAAPSRGKLVVKVLPDLLELRDVVSLEAIKHLSNRQVSFTIEVGTKILEQKAIDSAESR